MARGTHLSYPWFTAWELARESILDYSGTRCHPNQYTTVVQFLKCEFDLPHGILSPLCKPRTSYKGKLLPWREKHMNSQGPSACTRLSFCISARRHTGHYFRVESQWSSAQLNMVMIQFQEKNIEGRILKMFDYDLLCLWPQSLITLLLTLGRREGSWCYVPLESLFWKHTMRLKYLTPCS